MLFLKKYFDDRLCISKLLFRHTHSEPETRYLSHIRNYYDPSKIRFVALSIGWASGQFLISSLWKRKDWRKFVIYITANLVTWLFADQSNCNIDVGSSVLERNIKYVKINSGRYLACPGSLCHELNELNLTIDCKKLLICQYDNIKFQHSLFKTLNSILNLYYFSFNIFLLRMFSRSL